MKFKIQVQIKSKILTKYSLLITKTSQFFFILSVQIRAGSQIYKAISSPDPIQIQQNSSQPDPVHSKPSPMLISPVSAVRSLEGNTCSQPGYFPVVAFYIIGCNVSSKTSRLRTVVPNLFHLATPFQNMT